MRILLVLMSVGLLISCALSTVHKSEGSPSPQEECVNGCLNTYSASILECDKTVAIGPQLDLCYEQSKEKWAECKKGCSKVGNLK
jgi:hypothetical protein